MLLDFIDLKNGSGAVYRRLYEALHTAIVNGVIKNGECLPSISGGTAVGQPNNG